MTNKGDDHATRRDGAAATRWDAGGTTRRDSPSATARENGHVGATTRDGVGSGREYGIVLPDHLARDYTVVDDLSTGGEATVAVVQHRDTGAIKVVKIYRQGITLPQSMIDKLKNADGRHVLRVERSLYTGWATPRFVEVMEYLPAGSLAVMLDNSPGGLPALARQILTEMTDALEYIHDGLNLVHRDIKPANVLIRQSNPLDLVLADLGIASELDEIARSRRETTGSVKGTPAYQSPETLNSSDAGRARDWWALGMTMCEVLTGQHPFKDSAGNELRDEGRIRQAITMGEIDLSIITDDRWNLLCRGLLSHHPDDRWGSRQVRAWLAGESPAVVSRQRAAAPDRSVASFMFAGRAFTDPVALSAHMVANWDKATELFSQQSECEALRTWVREDLRDNSIATNLLSTVGSNSALADARIIAFTTHYRGPGDVHLRGVKVTAGDLAMRYLKAGGGWKDDPFLKLLQPKVVDALVESQYNPAVGQSGQSPEYRALAQLSRYALDTDREVTAAVSEVDRAASEHVYGADIGVDVRRDLPGRIPRAQALARAALLSPVCLNDIRSEFSTLDRVRPPWFADLCNQAGIATEASNAASATDYWKLSGEEYLRQIMARTASSTISPAGIARMALATVVADLASYYEQARANAEVAERRRQADAAAADAADRRSRLAHLTAGGLTGVAMGLIINGVLNMPQQRGRTLGEEFGVPSWLPLIVVLVLGAIGVALGHHDWDEDLDFFSTVIMCGMAGGPIGGICVVLGVLVSELLDNDSVVEKVFVVLLNGFFGGIAGVIVGAIAFGAAGILYAITRRIAVAVGRAV